MLSFQGTAATTAGGFNPTLQQLSEERILSLSLDVLSTLVPGAADIVKTVTQMLSLAGIKSPSAEVGIKELPEAADEESRGMTHSTLTRWVAYFAGALKNIHSHRSDSDTSEYQTLLQAAVHSLENEVAERLAAYAPMVEEAGRHGATAAQALGRDCPTATHSVSSHEVHQVNCAQARVQASTGVLYNAPVVNFTSQQQLMQTRFAHWVADTCHWATQVAWHRAEQFHVTMAGLQTRFGAAVDYHVSYRRYSGETKLVSGELSQQVGDLETEASWQAWVAENFTVKCFKGSARLVAKTNATVAAEKGIAALHGLRGLVHGDTLLSLSSRVLLTLDAKKILINSGRGLKAKRKQREVGNDVVLPLPSFADPDPYLKELAPLPVNRESVNGKAPVYRANRVHTGAGGFVSGAAATNLFPAYGEET